MEEKLSIVIAAYKGEKYIIPLLESLFAQTVKVDEILVSDDSPDDATKEIIEKVASSSPIPIFYSRNEAPLGAAGNFAHVIGKAAGDIIFICDQDDIWLPEKVELLLQELKDHPQTDVVFCNSKVVDGDLRDLGYSTRDVVHFFEEDSFALNAGNMESLFHTPMLYGHNIALRKRFLHYMLPMPELDSYDLYIALLAGGLGCVRCVYKDLTLHRRHGENQSMQERPGGVLTRFRQLKNKKKDTEILDSFTHGNAALERLEREEEKCPPKNMRLLRKHVAYYKARLLLHKKSRLIRPFYMLKIGRAYFESGNSFRSMIRDLLF